MIGGDDESCGGTQCPSFLHYVQEVRDMLGQRHNKTNEASL